MMNIVHSITGLLHLIMALTALISGTLVLTMSKGSLLHKRVGYVYFSSMLAMNGSAFFLYGLFGSFGPFHVAALISLATILAGMVPAFTRRPKKGWLRLHGTFMFFSTIGLYAALAAEIITRIPGMPFLTVVGTSCAIITALGVIVFRRYKSRWFPIGPT